MQLHIGRIVLDPMQLPGPIDGLRLWLIEFGVASRTGSSSRHWFVEKDFEGFFIDAARRWNVGPRRRISQEAMETRLEDQAIGRENVRPPVTNAHLVCSLQLKKNKKPQDKLYN